MLGLALLSTACPTTLNPESEATLSVRRQVQDFLDQRADHLESGDVERFLSPLSDEARATESPLAGSLGQIPAIEIRMELREGYIEMTPTQLTAAPVDLAYAYEGLPADNRFRIPFRYELELTDGGWFVEESRIEPGFRLPPWATGPVVTSRSSHFLALHRPETDPSTVLELAEEGRRQLERRVTLPLKEAHLMYLAASREQYDQMVATAAPASAIAQAETTYELRPAKIHVRSRVVVVNLAALGLGNQAVSTLQHELGHLALAPRTMPFTPAWVSESAAMYLADQRPESAWREGARTGRFEELSLATLSRQLTLGVHDATGEQASFEYAYSAAAAYYLVERYGADRYWSFYDFFSNVPAQEVYELVPATTAEDRDQEVLRGLAERTTLEALDEVFGVQVSQIDREVRRWIEERAG